MSVVVVGCGSRELQEKAQYREAMAPAPPPKSPAPRKKVVRKPAVEKMHPVLAKLESMTIPVIDFKNTTLEEAIDFLRIRSIELDPEPDMKNRGISFVIRSSRLEDDDGGLLGDSGDISGNQFSFHAENISFVDALVEISKLTGMDLYFTSGGFLGVPEGVEPVAPLPKGGEILHVIRKTTSQ